MENRPVISIYARTNLPEQEESYNKWFDGAYAPIYLKTGGLLRIDRYKIVRKDRTIPEELRIYHNQNYEAFVKANSGTDRNAAVRDAITTFSRTERFSQDPYGLIRSFKNIPGSQPFIESTIVDDAPIIHIEAYQLPETDSRKFEAWFSKWASLAYIPLLLKVPGVKACNFFRLMEFKDPILSDVRVVEMDKPRYLSIIYFDGLESVNGLYDSSEFAAFRGSLELGFHGILKILWDTEYQLLKSYKPQP